MNFEKAITIKKAWNKGVITENSQFTGEGAEIKYANGSDEHYVVIHVVDGKRDFNLWKDDFLHLQEFLEKLNNIGKFYARVDIDENMHVKYKDMLPTYDVSIVLSEEDEEEEE